MSDRGYWIALLVLFGALIASICFYFAVLVPWEQEQTALCEQQYPGTFWSSKASGCVFKLKKSYPG